MQIEQVLINRLIKDIDLEDYKQPIEDGIRTAIESGEFADGIAEGLQESGIAYEIGEALAAHLSDTIINKLKGK